MPAKITWGHDVVLAYNKPVTFIPQRCIVYLDGDGRWFQNQFMNNGEGGYADGSKVAQKGIEFILQGLTSPTVIAFGNTYQSTGGSGGMDEFRTEWTNAGATCVDDFATVWDSTKLRDYDTVLSYLTPHPVVVACAMPGNGVWTYSPGTYYAGEVLYRYVAQGGRLWLNYGYFQNTMSDPNFVQRIFTDLLGWTLTADFSADIQFGNLTLASVGDEGIISTNGTRKGVRISSPWIATYDDSKSAVYHAEHTVVSEPKNSGNVIGTWNPNGIGVNS